MRAVVQRVNSSHVTVNGKIIGKISFGLNVLLGISKEDTTEDVNYMSNKILNLRIFQDENEKLNKSIIDVNGEIIIISQFTIYGDCRKGKRPSFIQALNGNEAKLLYQEFVKQCKLVVPNVQTGEFGADMEVFIQNDGPVTLLLDSKKDF